jgi:hypothetical protein
LICESAGLNTYNFVPSLEIAIELELVPTEKLSATVFSGAPKPTGLATLPATVVTDPAVICASNVPERHEVMSMVNVVPLEAFVAKTQPGAVP